MNIDIPIIPNPIKLTQIAADNIKRVIEEESIQEQYLRIAIFGGGCSGLQYSLDFVDNINEEFDLIFEDNNIKIVIDCFSASHLQNTEIDFVDSIDGVGFKFNNDNQNKKHCGCGQSFGYY